MKRAGIIIDAWKLEIFERHLTEAGYMYIVKAGVSEDTLAIHVSYEWAGELQEVVREANEESRARKPFYPKNN